MSTTTSRRRRPATKRSERRSVTINLRATATWRALVDQAAGLAEKTRSEFIIEATRREAEAALLDRRFFALDDKTYRAFTDILDRPPPATEELRKLMAAKAPWQK